MFPVPAVATLFLTAAMLTNLENSGNANDFLWRPVWDVAKWTSPKEPSHIVPTSAFIIRRRAVVCALSALALTASARLARGQQATRATPGPDKRWYEQAVAMRQLAQSWGDQFYGAVLVLGDELAGEGPSRVVQRGDPNAHAEREAIRDAQRRLKRRNLEGSVLYSTSRPCAACEAAAAAAGVSRMYFGESLQDAGAPRQHGRNQEFGSSVRIIAR